MNTGDMSLEDSIDVASGVPKYDPSSVEALAAQSDANANRVVPDILGATPQSTTVDKQKEVDKLPLYTQAVAALRDSFAANAYRWSERHLMDTDPNFKLKDHWAELQKDVPMEYWDKFDGVRSLTEAQTLKGELLKSLEDLQVVQHSGAVGYASYMLGGVVDLDAPITFLSGGSYLEAKAGVQAAKLGRIGRAISTGAAGLESGLIVGAGHAATAPTGDWTDLPQMAMGGLVFGTATGALRGKKLSLEEQVNASAANLRKDFAESVADGQTGNRDYQSSHPEADPTFDLEGHKTTVEEQAKVSENIGSLEKQMADLEKEHDALPVGDAGRQPIKDAMAKLADQRIEEMKKQKLLTPDAHKPELTPAQKRYAAKSEEDKAAIRSIQDAKLKDVEKELAPYEDGTYKDLSEDEIAMRDELRAKRDTLKKDRADMDAVDNPKRLLDRNGDSVGASSTSESTGPDPYANLNEEGKRMKDEAVRFNQEHGLGTAGDFAFPNTRAGRAARKMYDMIQKTPYAADFDRLWNSPSPMARALAYKLLESPAGLVRNNRSAALLYDMYLSNISHDVNVNYNTAFNKWLKERKSNVPTAEALATPALREKFNQEFKVEMDSRYHDGGSHPDTLQAIKEFADHADNAYARALEILRGRQGETSVRGAENLETKSGYFPQRWSGQKVTALIRRMTEDGIKDARAAIERTLQKQYQAIHGWDDKTAMAMAKAITRRAIAKERGIDTNVKRLLDQEGAEFATQMLIDNGVSKKVAEKVIEELKASKADSKKESVLKKRTDIDARTKIEGTDYTINDLLDTDVVRVHTAYSRQVAGAAALARHGIQRADWKDIVRAIKDDEVGQSGKQHIPDDFYDGLYSHFSGGAIAGGLNPWIRRANQLTNLSLLNSLGLTQMAETGVNIAAMGVKVFIQTTRKEVRDMLSGKGNNQAMRELSKWLAPIDGEHMAIREDLMLDAMRNDPGHYSDLGNWLDRMGSKGQRMQGYVTGFYYVKQLQQRIAIRGMMHRLGQMYNEGKLISERRLEDMGLSAKSAERIGKYFKDGTIEFEKDGGIKALNPEKWNPNDFEEFVNVLNRHTHQVVQKAMKGEDSLWMHRDTGAMLMHLKNFTMLSLQKQLLRNARIMDTVSATGFLYGLGTAAAVYAAKQGLSGKDENLDAEHIARGAFNLSNMTSVIPSFIDPVAQMTGLQDYKMNNYGTMGGGSPLIPIPPMFPTLSRLAMAPIGYKHLATGQYTKSDINAIQATPLIGNALGFSYIFNQLKDSAKTRGEINAENAISGGQEQPASKPAPAPTVPKAPKEAKPMKPIKVGGKVDIPKPKAKKESDSVDLLNTLVKSGGGQ